MDRGTLVAAAGIALVVGSVSGRVFSREPAAPSPAERLDPVAAPALGIDADEARRIADEVATQKVDALDRRVASLEAELGSANADALELAARVDRLEARTEEPAPTAAPAPAPAPAPPTLAERIEEEARRITAEAAGSDHRLEADDLRAIHAQSRVLAERRVRFIDALAERAARATAGDARYPRDALLRAYQVAAQEVFADLLSAIDQGDVPLDYAEGLLRLHAERALARERVDAALEAR